MEGFDILYKDANNLSCHKVYQEIAHGDILNECDLIV